MAPSFCNKGVASETTGALIQQNPRRNKTIFAAVFQDNLAYAWVLMRCGFDYVGGVETYSVSRQTTVATWIDLRTFDMEKILKNGIKTYRIWLRTLE